MIQNPYKGLFIVIEGLDGSGSSTQVDLLIKNFKKAGKTAYATKEPTNNIIGGIIRGQLSGDWKTGTNCLELLFAADRAHHIEKTIVPNLKKGKILISDRYFFSSIAFGAINQDRDWLLQLNNQFIYPDLTFIIKVPPKTCIQRIKKSRLKFELFEQEEKLKKAWKTYLWLSKNFKDVYIIDGTKDKEIVAKEIFEITEKYINLKCEKIK
jgi:dTMP kinase